MRKLRITTAIAGVLAVAAALPISARAEEPGFAPECLPPTDEPVLTVGVVECQRIDSEHIGNVTAFSYYIPPACAPGGNRRCPVVYYLHGTGGSYPQGTGSKGSSGNAWVKALTSGPPVDPRTHPEPWTMSSPSSWVPRPALDLILVSPHGLTVPGGHGPTAGVDTGWADWNPKYARGGIAERYDTPPPMVESFLVNELVPYVDRHFPTGAAREWRAITGKSQGGFGSFANGLAHPDIWSVQAMLSGGGFPFPLLAVDGGQDIAPVQVAPLAPTPYLDPPGPVPLLAPAELFSTMVVAEVTVGFGDAVVDNVWWRSINPTDLIGNGRAWAADGTQSTSFKYHVNDAVPRRIPQDLADSNYPLNQGYETLLYPLNLFMEHVFARHGIERTFHVGPGLHNNDPYQQPYYREHLEAYAAELHGGHRPDGGRPWPSRFDYRSPRAEFSIWEWRVEVDREPIEFLFLTDVTCDAITLRGSGVVTLTAPTRCGTGVDGSPTFVVDLGPSHPVNDPAGASSSPEYGKVVTVELTPLSAGPGPSPSHRT